MTEQATQQVALPSPGQTVLVRHRSVSKKNGTSELQVCSGRDSVVQKIVAVYVGGKVKTQSGDVWDVKPAGSKTDWVTQETVTAS